MSRIEILQCSGLPPGRDVLSFRSTTGVAAGAPSRFRTIQDLPKDLSAALRQAEGEEDRPQGFCRLPAVPTGGIRLKREGRKPPWSTWDGARLIGGAASPGHRGQPTAWRRWSWPDAPSSSRC